MLRFDFFLFGLQIVEGLFQCTFLAYYLKLSYCNIFDLIYVNIFLVKSEYSDNSNALALTLDFRSSFTSYFESLHLFVFIALIASDSMVGFFFL